MEIPAALHGLQTQYESVVSHFNFGSFDPLEQAFVFRKQVEKFLSSDQDKTFHENLLVVPLDKRLISDISNFQESKILFESLWDSFIT